MHVHTYAKPVSIFPPCPLDFSFWLPDSISANSDHPITLDEYRTKSAPGTETEPLPSTKSNQRSDAVVSLERELFEIIREVAGNMVEQVCENLLIPE
ncbi:unnamed protein product [Protopolystoma xenopodis]|uniref:Uncharacterized protein n=1 Tax=Protopolystoma xenopodis TaxID=117903 RepID=A0A3S5BXX2_9PLAT|nr:unnamed protein product [Protopolystoma xenopodis]